MASSRVSACIAQFMMVASHSRTAPIPVEEVRDMLISIRTAARNDDNVTEMYVDELKAHIYTMQQQPLAGFTPDSLLQDSAESHAMTKHLEMLKDDAMAEIKDMKEKGTNVVMEMNENDISATSETEKLKKEIEQLKGENAFLRETVQERGDEIWRADIAYTLSEVLEIRPREPYQQCSTATKA